MTDTVSLSTAVAELNRAISGELAAFYAAEPLALVLNLEGTELLMHSPSGMRASETALARKEKIIPSPEEEAERGAYRNAAGVLVLPSANVIRSFVEAARGFKDPRRPRASLERSFVAGVRPAATAFPLYDIETGEELTTFEIHSARVTLGIGKSAASVIRARPLIPAWSAVVTVTVDAGVIDPMVVPQVAATAGRTIGVGDWRPEKRGPYGTYRVTGAEVLS